jgi:hypothetical protein
MNPEPVIVAGSPATRFVASASTLGRVTVGGNARNENVRRAALGAAAGVVPSAKSSPVVSRLNE